MFTREEFDNAISGAKTVAITSHISPDPDAMSSTLAIDWYIRNYFPDVTVEIAYESEIDPDFATIPNAERIKEYENISEVFNKADVQIFVDGNALHRFTNYEADLLSEGKITICMDHHKSEGADFTLRYVDTTAASAAQLITETLLQDDLDNPEVAKIVLPGISSDTGSFRFVDRENVRVMRTAADIVERSGVDLQGIDLQINSYSPVALDIITTLLEHMQNVEVKDGIPGLSYSYLNKDEFADVSKITVSSSYHKFQFNYMRRIVGYPWGFTVVPKAPGVFRISFRSTPGLPNVRLIAEEFGGGGHDLAAGGSYTTDEDIDTEEVARRIYEKIKSLDIVLTPKEL